MRPLRSLALLLLLVCLLPWGAYAGGTGVALSPPAGVTAQTAGTGTPTAAGPARKCRIGLPGDCGPDRLLPPPDLAASPLDRARPARPGETRAVLQPVPARPDPPPRPA